MERSRLRVRKGVEMGADGETSEAEPDPEYPGAGSYALRLQVTRSRWPEVCAKLFILTMYGCV